MKMDMFGIIKASGTAEECAQYTVALLETLKNHAEKAEQEEMMKELDEIIRKGMKPTE